MVQALLPSTLISQADALLLAHRLEDVTDLAEQQRKKLQSMLNAERHEVSNISFLRMSWLTGMCLLSWTSCAM